jgi:hypothetical protein
MLHCPESRWTGFLRPHVDHNPEAYVFAGETGQPLWRSSLLEDHIRAKLEPIGLGWVNFQVMRGRMPALATKTKWIRRCLQTSAAASVWLSMSTPSRV